MSKPIVIRQSTGAIATIVLYLRRKFKLSPEIKKRAIKMAEKKKKPEEEDDEEESVGYSG